jgi:predicted nucleic acid-binding Zn ribbon protein
MPETDSIRGTSNSRAARRASARRVGTLLSGALARLGLADGIERWRAVLEWDAIAGESLARHAKAVRVEGTTLVVEAEHSAVLYELSHRKAELLDRLHAHVGGERIKDVRLVLKRN